MGERFPFPLGNNLQFTLVEEVSTGFVAASWLSACATKVWVLLVKLAVKEEEELRLVE